MKIRRALRYARACAYEWSGANRRSRSRLDGTCAAVLMYHRVLPATVAAQRAVEPGMYVTPESFARHLGWLASSFHVLPLHEIVSRLAQSLPLPRGACAITFDDGWRDNHDFALPELERRALPATIFVVTDRVGTSGSFWTDEVGRRMAEMSDVEQYALLDALGIASRGVPTEVLLAQLKGSTEDAREKALDRLRSETRDPCAGERELLDWSELDRLGRAGVDVEAHGATHAILTLVSGAEAERDLRSAREHLRGRGHGRHGLLAYPSGGHDAAVRRLARDAGYAAAFTTEPGLAKPADDRFELPRLGLHDDVSRTRVEFLYRVPGIVVIGQAARVLVTDGETRAALACVRALALRGHTVHVAAAGSRSLAGASRYASGAHDVGDANTGPREFAERLVRVASSLGADLIIPVTEVSLGSIYAFGVQDRCAVACPERAAYEVAVDKHELLQRAARSGLAVPRTLLFEDPTQLSGLPGPFQYPVVLKSRRSRFLSEGRWRAGEVRIVHSAADLSQARSAPGFFGGVLLQEFIPGCGEGVFLLTDQGRPLARFAHRRIREKPPWGGVSVLSEAIAPDPGLLAGSERLLAELAWTGVAMVEFRRAPAGGAFLMEVNPRLWGSVQLAIDAGVDFPSLLIALHRGEPLFAVQARIGTRTRWLLGDLDHLLICLRRPEVRRQRGTSVFALLRDFVQSFFDGSRLEVLRRDDWRPFLRELRDWLRT